MVDTITEQFDTIDIKVGRIQDYEMVGGGLSINYTKFFGFRQVDIKILIIYYL